MNAQPGCLWYFADESLKSSDVKSHSLQNTPELASMLNISRCAVCCHIEMIGKMFGFYTLLPKKNKKTKGVIDKVKRKLFITDLNPIKHERLKLVRHNSILHMILELIL